MTDTPGNLMLPVDGSPPPERLRWPMLLLLGAGVVLIHLALFTVFTPLAPEPVEDAPSRADRTFSFISSRTANADPLFLRMVDTCDPISFLHPPETVGFSFFRAAQVENGPEAAFEPPLPAGLPDVPQTQPVAMTEVSRPLLPDTPDYRSDEVLPEVMPAYPYWAADSVSGIVFPAFRPSAAAERILQRQRPAKPSVFRIKEPILPDLPYEASLDESCGVTDLDLEARAWLDTHLNSSDCPAGLKNDGSLCRVVWSAAALRKEAVR